MKLTLPMKFKPMALGLSMAAAVVGANQVHAEEFVLRIGSGHPSEPVPYANKMEHFLAPEITKRVAERTDHEIKFVNAYAGTVAKVHETLEAVQSGLLDIGGFCVCFETSKTMPLGVSYYVPFSSPDVRVDVKVVRQLIEEFPGMQADLEEKYGQVLLGISGFDNYGLGTNFAWESIEDLKGHKILAAGPNLPWLEGSGAVAVTGTLPTNYNQLKTGVADGIIAFPAAYVGVKLYEVAEHYKRTDFGGTMQIALTMNARTREQLPDEVVAIIDEVASEWETVATEHAAAQEEIGYKKLKAAGATFSEISRDAQADWAEGLEPFVQARAEALNDLGLPGVEILNRYIELSEEYGHEFPYRYKVQ